MAINSKTTLTRDLSADSSEGLGIAIADAFEQNFGFDKNGSKQEQGGTNQQSTIDLKWRGTILETKQKFFMDTAAATSGVLLQGSDLSIKSADYTVTSTVSTRPSDNLVTFRVTSAAGTVTDTTSFPPSGASLTPANAVLLLRIALRKSKFSNIIASIDNTVSTSTEGKSRIVFTEAAGDASVSIIVGGSQTGTQTTVQAFKAQSKAATLVIELVKNLARTDAKQLTFPETSDTINIAAGGSILWYTLANPLTGLLGNSPQIESRVGVTNGYEFGVASGYGVAELTVRVTLTQEGQTTKTFDIVAALTGANTVAYVEPKPESYGTMLINVADPLDSSVYSVTVTVPQNDPITDIEDRIIKAFKETVIGTTEDGKVKYVSSFVTPSTSGTPVVGTDDEGRATHDFTITLDWTAVGPAGIPSLNQDGMTDVDPTNFATAVTVTAGVDPVSTDFVPWDSVSTSSTLQPGGDTMHYATLIYTKV